MMPTRPTPGLLLAAFIGSVALANAATAHLGGTDHMIPIGLGLTATAGTLFAGLCLALRDALQDAGGRWLVITGIGAGAITSVITSSPALAAASGIAFAVSELADAAVYTPIRARAEFGDRWWAGAVIISGLIGALIDTIVFLALAGFPIWSAVPGQMVGKTYATLGFLALGLVARRALLHNPKHA